MLPKPLSVFRKTCRLHDRTSAVLGMPVFQKMQRMIHSDDVDEIFARSGNSLPETKLL